MVIIMQREATPDEIQAVIETVEESGFRAFVNPGVERKVIALLGAMDAEKATLADRFTSMPGVERVALISEPYKLASRQTRPDDTIVRVGRLRIGGPSLAIIAGPCSVESLEQILEVAHAVKAAGANLLRGGAFKPRTSPYAFQGLGLDALDMLARAREETGLPIVTEVLDPHELPMVMRYADIVQIGARNMQNFRLLQRVGQCGKPVVLKRGPGCRVQDLLMACEYIMLEGNRDVILCERGITTFEDSTRYTTDINAVPVLKRLSHLPVILDPSHSTGDWRYVTPLAKAAIAAGADGLMVEVHPNPPAALSDGPQSLEPPKFAAMMRGVGKIARAVGRRVPAARRAH
ncbi:MAG: 3-deoxy-7-phosphoheptulonate synthase [Armatimonadota bacterium]|nr:MAG: 3-deoxy-7-phosphoheptulonate synthase [Armatimonadota bacterium]